MRYTIALFLATHSLGPVANSQCTPASLRADIRISNAGTDHGVLWCGVDANGSYGLNTSLCEIEYPPPPPDTVFDVRFVNIPGREGMDTPAGLGQGLSQDYREDRIGGEGDTFKIRLQSGSGGYPIRLDWSASSPYFYWCDSVILIDEFDTGEIHVRMDRDSTFSITNPAIRSLLIIMGHRIIQDVHPTLDREYKKFKLLQNYPNPFNASTTLRYQLPSRSHVKAVVYDVLGRQVRTLVDRMEDPGSQSTSFDASELTSGVYLCRLSVDGFVQTQKMILQK